MTIAATRGGTDIDLSRFFASLIAPRLERLTLADQARHKTDAPVPDQLRRISRGPESRPASAITHSTNSNELKLRTAAAHRLADRIPARSRIARLLRRAIDRQDAAPAASGPVGKALAQHS